MSKRTPGTGTITADGYIYIEKDGVAKFEHVLIAEQALGRPLPKLAGVHHVNSCKADNRNENLVIFPNTEYHLLLHTRTKAIEATGDPNMRKCAICGEYDHACNLYIWKRISRHKSCKTKYDKERNKKK